MLVVLFIHGQSDRFSSPLHQFAAIGARLPGHLGRGTQKAMPSSLASRIKEWIAIGPCWKFG
jgi:hypothetical protein